MFKCFLEKQDLTEGRQKQIKNPYLYLWGVTALWMRQTNVFWTAVWMGGLEVIRVPEKLSERNKENGRVSKKEEVDTWKGWTEERWSQWRKGKVHDVALRDAGIEGTELPAANCVL